MCQDDCLHPVCINIPNGVEVLYVNNNDLDVLLNLEIYGYKVRTFPSADLRYIKNSVDAVIALWDKILKRLVILANEYYKTHKKNNPLHKIKVSKEDIFIEKIVYYPVHEKEYMSTVMITYNFGESSMTIPLLILKNQNIMIEQEVIV